MEPFRWYFRLSGGILDKRDSASFLMSIILSQIHSCASGYKLLEGPTVLQVSLAFLVFAARLVILLLDDLVRDARVRIPTIPKPRFCPERSFILKRRIRNFSFRILAWEGGKGAWRSQTTLVSKLCPAKFQGSANTKQGQEQLSTQGSRSPVPTSHRSGTRAEPWREDGHGSPRSRARSSPSLRLSAPHVPVGLGGSCLFKQPPGSLPKNLFPLFRPNF